MCGIAGLIDRRAETSEEALQGTVRAMADTLTHRGPDGSGVWCDAAAGVALGHRRLAIIDLSLAGHQPMLSADERYVISYNGEVFNFGELRRELELAGRKFRGGSDTEVIVEACATWGVDAAVRRLIGMFAFALWDRGERVFTLVRDRLGIKPLYYRIDERRFMFGSEIKALRACPGWQAEIDQNVLAAYMRHNYVPSPYSIYQGVRKLPPGTILTLASGRDIELSTYWNARQVARTGVSEAQSDRRVASEASEQLDTLLRDAVRRRMVADVPLGAFLSGGIDSSTVVALMQAESNRSVKTFTIGFGEPKYDEAQHAKRVAAHLRTEHTELYVGREHALDIVPQLPEVFDEPFADPSQIPTILVSEMTRRHVTVALSGDGGDELFAGYPRYFTAAALGNGIDRLPLWLRRTIACALRSTPDLALRGAASVMPRRWRPARPVEAARKLAAILRAETGVDSVYRHLVSQWDNPAAIVTRGQEPSTVLWDPTVRADIPATFARLQLFDLVTYLPDDILTKVDRASMSVSLEARVPLLDHRVVEFAWRLPEQLRVRNGDGKWLLREVLARYVPRELFDRPKMGFGVPLDTWLRGPLRDWAEDLLHPETLMSGGMLRPEPIRLMWREHLAGTRNEPYRLWTVLMFQAWRRHWRV